ncbi:MAG TPA: type II secretion system F family protein [Acidimicrobiales bacterium]|nr:type II secretion system F family protein [Acidimicrobiales bacterium]
MTIAILASIGVALGLVGMVASLRPARPSAASVLLAMDRASALHHRGAMGMSDPVGNRGRGEGILTLHRRVGLHLANLLLEHHALPTDISSSVLVTGASLEELCARSLLGVAGGFACAVALSVLTALASVHLPWVASVAVGIALVVVGAVAPLAALRSEAKKAKKTARTVIGSFLNLVVLCLAGGMGVESALHEAAAIADAPFSRRLVETLELARDTGQTPWHALGELGEALAINELVELSAAVGLAGTEGARIRATLAAKAASIRRHELSDAEAEANTLTEKLFLPGVLLLVGFLLFVGYPAVARIAGGF